MSVSDKMQIQAGFWRKTLRLTRGRVTLMRALEVAAEEEADPKFAAVIRHLRKTLDDGATFAEAVAGRPDVFPLSVIELIRTAEKCGEWDEILEEIASGLAEGTFTLSRTQPSLDKDGVATPRSLGARPKRSRS